MVLIEPRILVSNCWFEKLLVLNPRSNNATSITFINKSLKGPSIGLAPSSKASAKVLKTHLVALNPSREMIRVYLKEMLGTRKQLAEILIRWADYIQNVQSKVNAS